MVPGIKEGVVIAINKSKISNCPESFQLMEEVGPKVCITTANHPGFLGFLGLVQMGAHAAGGRYGAAQINMQEQLNPLRLYQYTVWESAEAHEEMHYQNFDNIFELCSRCLKMVVEGPWEPLFEVQKVDLPPLVGMTDVPETMGRSFAEQKPVPKVRLHQKRVIVIGDHGVMEGHEEAFTEGVVETMEFLKENVPGLVGWMLLKPIGVSAIGSFQLAPEQAIQAVSTLGSNPPEYRTNYGDTWKLDRIPPIPPEKPANYVVHMEWESPEAAQSGLAMAFTSPALRKIHNPGVLAHVIKGPYYSLFGPMMEERIMFP